MKRVIGVATAWAGIVGLAWWLADQRIELCRSAACRVSATADRDFLLIAGLVVVLAAVLAAGFIAERRAGRPARPTEVHLAARWDATAARRSATATHFRFAELPPFHKATISYVVLLVALLGAVIWQLSADTGESRGVIENNYDAAADNLEAMADATARSRDMGEFETYASDTLTPQGYPAGDSTDPGFAEVAGE